MRTGLKSNADKTKPLRDWALTRRSSATLSQCWARVRICPIYPHVSVGADLVSARVSRNDLGVITTGGHKILPYDVVVI